MRLSVQNLSCRRSGRLDGIVNLRDYAVRVVSALSRRWFGLPLDDGAFDFVGRVDQVDAFTEILSGGENWRGRAGSAAVAGSAGSAWLFSSAI